MRPLYLIIHHSATPRDTTTFASVKAYHVSKGWGDIGYHYFITPTRCHSGRAENVVGAHCRADGMNFKSLGICLAGNFEVERPTDWQLDRLERLVKDLQRKYNIDNQILAHREVKGAATACCGKNLLPHVIGMRDGGIMPNMYKGLDLTNIESMKTTVDIWDDVVNQKKYVSAEDYAKLETTTETRINAEKERYDEFLTKLSKLLGIPKDEPKILEDIAGLVKEEDIERSGEIEVKHPGHSKLCRLLAKFGL